MDDQTTPQLATSTDDALQASLPDPLPDHNGQNISLPNDAPLLAATTPADDDAATDTTSESSPSMIDDTPVADAPVAAGSTPSTDDLLSIKQEALQQLSPLVGHLDQTPEEKFRTTMMMIQAADDQSLLKDAYEAAKQITDERTRAQALLDVVNEVNYFTQQHAN